MGLKALILRYLPARHAKKGAAESATPRTDKTAYFQHLTQTSYDEVRLSSDPHSRITKGVQG